MAKNKYKQITFAEGYNKPFADFKKEFENTHVFKAMVPKVREEELKKAYKIATKGNVSGTSKKSTKSNSSKSKK